MFPPGGAGFAGVPKIAPGGVYAADASSQTIGTTGANAAAQTAPGNPFTVEGDLRFPLESMRNTSMFGMENTGSYDEFRQNVVRFRLYRHRFLQENMRFAAFFIIYQII